MGSVGVVIEGRGDTLTATTPTVTPIATTTHHTSPAEFWSTSKKITRYVKQGLDRICVVCKDKRDMSSGECVSQSAPRLGLES